MSTSTLESATVPAVDQATIARKAAVKSPKVHHRYCRSDHFDTLSRDFGDSWLSRRERAELAAWRDDRRRRAWLLSRMIGKQLIADVVPGLQQKQIEVLSRDAQGRVNRPRIWWGGAVQPWSLSIAHSHRGVLVALSADEDISVGVDLAECETFSDGFVDLWFTPGERNWFHETQSPSIACFIWAAKEALYKACNRGESFAPRDVEVSANGQCSYHQAPLSDCRLQSWTIDGHLAVLATVACGVH